MRSFFTILLVLGGTGFIGSGRMPQTQGQAPVSVIHAGFAQMDITPDTTAAKVYIAGFGSNRVATGVHDPLFARAIVLEQPGGKKIGIISVDLVGLFHDFTLETRKLVPELDYLVVCSTHNHNGPDTLGLWGPGFGRSGVDKAYVRSIQKRIPNLIKEAMGNRVPCKLVAAKAPAPELLRDGRLPDIKHDDLVVLRFDDAKSGKPHGFLLQWNNHPETVDSDGTLITADFPTPALETISKSLGCKGIYLTGTVGGLMTTIGVKVKDKSGKELPLKTFETMNRLGELLGEKALVALKEAQNVPFSQLEYKSKIVHFPVENRGYQAFFKLGVFNRKAFVETTKGQFESIQPADAGDRKFWMQSEVGWIGLGDAEFFLVPGEIYPELVLGKFQDPVEPGADFPDAPLEKSLFSMSKAKWKMTVGLANDEVGYIIPKRQWDEKAPFCYGREKSQYGEINSLGNETAPRLSEAFRELFAK